MNTPSSREADRIALAAQVAAFTGQVEVLPGFPERPTYAKRTNWIDPATRLKRQPKQAQTFSNADIEAEEHQRSARKRGMALLRKDWPELNLMRLSRESGVSCTTILFRIGSGETLSGALRK